MARQFVIIGNGIAGITTAATLADSAPDANVIVYADEKYPYYRRPWLPDFLAGKHQLEELYAYPTAWYAKRRIQVRLSQQVAAIVPDEQRIALASGESVHYDKLLLSCGGYSFVPPVSNANLTGSFTLRTLDEALAIREYAHKQDAAVVIGGGLLGLEAARGLKGLGLSVTVIEIFPRLLPRQLDAEGATVLTTLMEQMGVSVITGATVETVAGEKVVTGVRLKDGKEVSAGMVLFSAGIRPKLDLAKAAGLSTNRGVIADEHLQTSIPGVFVAGDAAEFKERLFGIIPAAIEQARVAAANMLDLGSTMYTATVPINTLKVMGIDLTSIGVVNPEEPGYAFYRRTDAQKGLYKKLVFKDGALVGTILLGDRKSVTPMTRLINQKAEVESLAERMLQDDFDFKPLL
jgi:nitrite reductase (NADH) large subunit